MKRFHLFEFNDLKFWPSSLRSLTTDFLQATIEKNKPYLPRVDLIVKAIIASKSNKIIDICSGSLGPWKHLKNEIEKICNKNISITFTDKYPNQKLFRELNEIPNSYYHKESIDARNVPNTLQGTRTIFNGLHHFNKQDAQKIIDNAVENKQSIVIFELLSRSWLDVTIVALFTPIYTLLFMPFLLKISFKNILLTYIIPIFPITFTWDCVVSNLRSYTIDELETMMEKADTDKIYKWRINKYRHNFFPVLYLVAYVDERKLLTK